MMRIFDQAPHFFPTVHQIFYCWLFEQLQDEKRREIHWSFCSNRFLLFSFSLYAITQTPRHHPRFQTHHIFKTKDSTSSKKNSSFNSSVSVFLRGNEHTSEVDHAEETPLAARTIRHVIVHAFVVVSIFRQQRLRFFFLPPVFSRFQFCSVWWKRSRVSSEWRCRRWGNTLRRRLSVRYESVKNYRGIINIKSWWNARHSTILNWQAIDGNILHFSTARDGMGGKSDGSWVPESRKSKLWKRENGKYWLLGALGCCEGMVRQWRLNAFKWSQINFLHATSLSLESHPFTLLLQSIMSRWKKGTKSEEKFIPIFISAFSLGLWIKIFSSPFKPPTTFFPFTVVVGSGTRRRLRVNRTRTEAL